ncbi:histidinol-phosphate transaminase [Klugiella xanthotipulae]|uniref:Histidinol-phosphate aminotransferase n=1 Tax=Klugiella xanthotipulae TaxID=244735 RepID=A0A543I415_9MICO|nr:histidinol-phosphate transaminase [Klugiella xanthotipulae]TQM65328.1 histidinol phosphate aminotransferase [Klugiella xanthotipulae]
MATLNDLPLRPDLVGKTPYGAPQDTVAVRLNVNENTHPIPEEVAVDIVSSLARAVTGVNRYPDREFVELRESLAAYLGHGLTADNLWAANGSNEVLQQILQAFGGPGRSLLSFVSTYSMYPLLANGTGTEWIPVPRDAGFELCEETALAAVREHSPTITIVCTPNNPTGTTVSLDVIRALYDATEGLLVVDEAYAEFAGGDYTSAVSLLPGRERLLVSRTMSKAFAFAGVRLGYLAADPAAVDALRLVRLPYHLSALTQAAGIAALRHAPRMLATVGDIRAERRRIAERLAELGYTVYPSESNFVLFGGVTSPQATFQALRERGILIRDVGIPNHLRVSAGTHAETSVFLDAIAALPR